MKIKFKKYVDRSSSFEMLCVSVSLGSVSNIIRKYTYLFIRKRHSGTTVPHPNLVHASSHHIYNLAH